MTGQTNGAEALINALCKLGVTTAYGVPGEETTALMAAIHRSPMSFVLCRHEQAAAFMASVHGRLTGRPAVCLSTLGPGATNLVTGVADAQLDHVPLIALTGQGERHRLGRESHQIIDLENLFAPVTKFSRTLLVADDIPASAAEAFRQALTEKPGAVHLCLPVDVAQEPCTTGFVAAAIPVQPEAASQSLADAALRIKTAARPVMVVGAGAIRAGAAQALQAFAEATQIPLATTFMAKGVLPPDHPQMLFTVGQPETDYVDLSLQAADLVIAVGFDPVEYPTLEITRNGAVPVVAIDTFAAPVDSGWSISVQVTGDVANAMTRLLNLMECRVWDENPAFAATRSGMHRTLSRQRSEARDGPIAPADICGVISQQLDARDTLLSGVGLHKLWLARHVLAKRAGQVIVPNGLAGMGLALPGAIAAARLQDEGRVLAVCGDGDMLMNVQEMETAARLGLRLTVMVWEDGGYGLIDEHQGNSAPEFQFNNPKWAKLADAFGWSYAPVSGLDALSEILEAAHSAEGPTLITVPVDYDAQDGMPGRLAA